MGYHNTFARQKLLESVKDLEKEFNRITFTEEDDELDKELKHGARGAIEFAIRLLHKRIEMLENEK